VRVHAAGSLRAVVRALGEAFTGATGVAVQTEFGASGLLRERLEKGEAGDVFMSANLEHPARLSREGKALPTVLFTRNELCALARRELSVTPATLLDRMLDPAVRLGTSTPRADPSGDYAWEVFRKSETLRPGSRTQLEAKALQLVGGPGSPPPPANRSIYAVLLEQNRADVFLTYCTNAAQVVREVPGIESIALPPELRVGADYGLTVLTGARVEPALRWVLFVLSPDGQAIVERFGFAAPTRPAPG
jgi:ABC-type molybdate transport system substrate-binding protein